jgi:hypothetical protein
MPPRVQLLAASGPSHPIDQASQYLACLLPTNMIQQFKGFVGKVYHVPSVQIEVIGGSSKDHICYGLLGQAQIYGSPEAAFRSFIIPNVTATA